MTQKDLRQFDYHKLARLDTDMWRAYYSHRFLRLFRLLLQLMHTQFQFGWLLTCKTAWYAVVAATDYRLGKGHENFPRIERQLVRFYKAISAHATEPFDYHKAARIELEWWNIHRYPNRYTKPLATSLAEGMAIVYNGNPNNFLDYGRYRAEAMWLRDQMGDVQKITPDWARIESLLAQSWQALHDAAQKNKRP